MEQTLIAAGVILTVVVLTTGVAATFAMRVIRRRYRSARERLRVISASRMPGQGSALRRPTAVAVATLGSPHWWAAQNRRHQMWRAVAAAEHAVGVARHADVPVGDLPALASRLRTAAGGVDSVLRANARLGLLRDEDHHECARIEAAAADIHNAATSSMRTAAHNDVDPVVAAVHIEVAALAAGVRVARG